MNGENYGTINSCRRMINYSSNKVNVSMFLKAFLQPYTIYLEPLKRRVYSYNTNIIY